MSRRRPRVLHVWDFDDTLAHSIEAVSFFAETYPEVPFKAWWHDPAISKIAIEKTRPRFEEWAMVERLPGTHLILTGRNGSAVRHWLKRRRNDRRIGKGVRRIKGVASTSPVSTPRVADLGTAKGKALLLHDLKKGFDEVHIHDDDPRNFEAILAEHPEVIIHGHHPLRVRPNRSRRRRRGRR